MSEPEGIAAREPVSPAPAAPVPPAERIPLLDILRGFAVFGILVVNMLFFSGPFEWVVDAPWQSWLDRTAGFLITAFFSGKFYSIFSILFGIGFAIQMERADERGSPGAAIYIRRLLVLLAIGVLHAAFLWYGDILHLYAGLGLLLLIFRRKEPETMIPLIVIGLAVAPGLAAIGALAASFAPAVGAEHDTAEIFRTAEAMRAYASGSWAEVTRQRIRDWLMLDSFAMFLVPSIFAMMLTGVAAAKARVFRALPERGPLFRRVLSIAFLPGLAGNIFVAAAREAVNPAAPTLLGVAVTAVQAVAVPALALTYVSALALVVMSGARMLNVLAPVGRMALTNYLLQSVIATLIFYSHGLGLFGRVGPAATTLLAVVIFAVQIAASAWWMKRFRFGPVEWVWRSLAYARWQRMR